MKVDKAILDTNEVICQNISRFNASERGLLSQNILSQLRNFVEYIAIKIYANGNDLDPYDYNINTNALSNLKTKGNMRFLYCFYDLLQKSVSHYTLDQDSSERLMLKYYEYLLRIKIFLNDKYNLEVLNNIDEFPLNIDPELEEYYEKIAEKIINHNDNGQQNKYSDRYYVQKVVPFFAKNNIFYEVTLTIANANVSKFDRVIFFTKHEIMENYSIKVSIHNESITIFDKEMPIQIIDDWSVSIRPCELDNFATILGIDTKISTSKKEYDEIMNYLTITKIPLSELTISHDKYYNFVKSKVAEKTSNLLIFNVLDKCREIVSNSKPGSNILLYLLHKLNNKVIKKQRYKESNPKLSDLYLKYGCIPFDNMPFCTSPLKHNPRISDLLECIPSENREHEFFARYIQNNTEQLGKLFTPIKEIFGFTKDIRQLIKIYNDNLYLPKHEGRKIMIFKDHIYIKNYADDCKFIIEQLTQLSIKGINTYTANVDAWLEESGYDIDSPEKKEAMRNMFEKSKIALIYGSAGTGKSTMINHISNFFYKANKLFISNTHPAVENMRNKVTSLNSEFHTVAYIENKKEEFVSCDLLIIDECSTISNADMRKILEKVEFKLLVLVGDIYQIESIYFGIWFDIIRKFIPQDFIIELKYPYRTQNKQLLTLWDRVRNLDLAILEILVKQKYSQKLDESIFLKTEENEIILCLNYDGLYGINNINRFLQNTNPNPAIQWGIGVYKIGDPILFNETGRFLPVIHNNSKGTILGITELEDKIWFEIELDCIINEANTWFTDLILLDELSEKGNSIVKFSVNKFKSTDEDDDNDETVVPFQIAYAISIHKAQGLEYNSVKVVVTNQIEDKITHSILYTAITRAKNKLKIFWYPETEKKVLTSLKLKNSDKDCNLLKKLYNL